MATLKRIIYLTKLRLWTTFGTTHLNRFLCSLSLSLFLSVSPWTQGVNWTYKRRSIYVVYPWDLSPCRSDSLCLSVSLPFLSSCLSLSLCVSMIWYGTFTFGTYTLVTFIIYYNNSCDLDVITNQNRLTNILTKNN